MSHKLHSVKRTFFLIFVKIIGECHVEMFELLQRAPQRPAGGVIAAHWTHSFKSVPGTTLHDESVSSGHWAHLYALIHCTFSHTVKYKTSVVLSVRLYLRLIFTLETVSQTFLHTCPGGGLVKTKLCHVCSCALKWINESVFSWMFLNTVLESSLHRNTNSGVKYPSVCPLV